MGLDGITARTITARNNFKEIPVKAVGGVVVGVVDSWSFDSFIYKYNANIE